MKNNKEKEIVLGIWDGHDSGAALLQGKEILYAANEERFTRRKLEILFPSQSIRTGLNSTNINPKNIKRVAYATTDPSKTLTRLLPGLKNRYYKIRRKKTHPTFLNRLQKKFKYFFTELQPNYISQKLSDYIIKKELSKLDIYPEEILGVDHHTAHAYSAFMSSKFEDCLTVTLDGIGDGLSGMVVSIKDHKPEILHRQSGKHSLGIFFEHVTSLLNMRELEDEGKVMALADFSLPLDKNPLLEFFDIEKGSISAKYNSRTIRKKLEKILWRYPLEQFAYLAQNALEKLVTEFVTYWLEESEHENLALAGGLFANIKVNQQLLELQSVKDLFIFPHMGDGGLAFGAAAYYAYKKQKVRKLDFTNCFLGPKSDHQNMRTIINKNEFRISKVDPIKIGSKIIANGDILFWYQGNMEYGPRALGHRSILCRSDSQKLKDKLNLNVKKRVWYQPFCPSILLEDAKELFEKVKGTANEFMTCGYQVKEKYLPQLRAVINIDGSCRPQIVLEEKNQIYYDLLKELKKHTGRGIVLNTSFNIHGQPIVNTPHEAIDVLKQSPSVKYLIINKYLIERK